MVYKKNPFGWHYPPGAEHHPNAPWNEKESQPNSCIECDHFEFGPSDGCWCNLIKTKDIPDEVNIYNEYPKICPLDRRSDKEMKEDYLADQADSIRKYGKEG